MAAASSAGGRDRSQQPDLTHLSQAISQAVFSCAEASVPKLPWEEAGLSAIFGQDPLEVVWGVSPDKVPFPIPVAPDAPLEVKEQAAKRVKVLDFEQPCYIKCVNFRNQATDEELEKGSWQKALEKWYVLVTQDPSVSLVGASIVGLDMKEGLLSLRELFGKKSHSTVDKRGSSLLKYIKFMQESHPHRPAFPLSTFCTDLYIRHLRATNAKASQVSSFVEAVRFAVHVVGLSADDASSGKLFSPWALGFQGMLMAGKDERSPSLVLTVKQVECLEDSLRDESLGLVDRYAAGVFLFCLYSRSRISDIRKVHGFLIDVVTDGGSAVGFLECGTRNHKTALQAQTVGVSMPLVAPITGVKQVPWGLQFVKLSEQVDLPFSCRDKGPLLPAPAQVSSAEAGRWLRALLSRCNACGDGVSGHSLKSTTLDWCGKYGMSDKDQTLLGHHALKGESMYSYMRDKLAAPLRAYEQMLLSIRHALFLPDSTRSGMFQPEVRAAADVPVQGTCANPRGVIPGEPPSLPSGVTHSEAVSEALEVGSSVPAESEQEHYAPVAESPQARAQSFLDGMWPPPGEENAEAPEAAGAGGSNSEGGQSSVSSSSSSESEASENEQDWVGDLSPELSRAVPKAKPAAPDMEFWKNPKTLTIHSLAVGSLKNTFTCGRKHTSEYVRITESAFLSSRLCEVCKKSKPLRDVGALTSMIDKGLRSG